jgi:hypothetical protein
MYLEAASCSDNRCILCYYNSVGAEGSVYTGRFCGIGVQGRSPWWGFGGRPQTSHSFAAVGGEPKKTNPGKVVLSLWSPVVSRNKADSPSYLEKAVSKEYSHERKTTLASGCNLVWYNRPARFAEAHPRTAKTNVE